jgi:tetratricopeptide (TPR) repeat protein
VTIEKLTPLRTSKNPYLAAAATYFSARAMIIDENYEQARPLLEQLVGPMSPHTLYDGEALFLLGVTQADLLERKEAIASLKAFCLNYPYASERMLVGALHMIEQLAAVQDGTLMDVEGRMDFSRRRLELARTADETQGQQKKIITILDKLIEQAEQNEQSGGGGGNSDGSGGPNGPGGGQAQGNQQSGGPAQNSTAPVGEARLGDLHRVHRGDPSDTWGNRPDKEREEVLNALKTRFPDRYRELVEQYYRSLQEKDR